MPSHYKAKWMFQTLEQTDWPNCSDRSQFQVHWEWRWNLKIMISKAGISSSWGPFSRLHISFLQLLMRKNPREALVSVFESEHSLTWSASNNLIWQSTYSKPYNSIQVGSYFGYTTRLLSHLFKRAGKPTINLGCLTWKKFWSLFGL